MNKKDENGNTPLFVACQLDDCIAIDIFSVYPDAMKQQSGWSVHRNPLHVACFHSGFIPTLRLMKSKDNTLIHEVDSDGRTPLFFAQPKIFKWLRREAKIDFNYKDKNGQTAFHYNCTQLNFEYCEKLLDDNDIEIDGNLSDNYGNNPLFSLIMIMFDESKLYNEEVWDRATDIIRAINKRYSNAKDCILANNENTLHLICKNYDKLEHVANYITKSIVISFISLINKGDSNGLTPIHLACHYDHDFIKILLTLKCTWDRNNRINTKIMINKKDNNGKTALHHACEFHNYKAFINIIEFEKLNIDLVDVDHNTVLHTMIENLERYCDNSILMIKNLLKKSPYMIYQINGRYKTPIGIIVKSLEQPSNA